jgi:hypothetical protein
VGIPKAVPYLSPTGKKQTVQEKEIRHGISTYTLVFDGRGLVVDVLYNEEGRHDGLSALSLQHMKGVQRMEEHTHPAGQ